MDSRRFTKIRTLKDIKVEKARIRYEMLVAENRLMENIDSIQRVIAITTIFSSITQGFQVALNVYQKVHKLIDKIFRRKKEKRKKYREED